MSEEKKPAIEVKAGEGCAFMLTLAFVSIALPLFLIAFAWAWRVALRALGGLFL